jgi:hypothetical protein
LFGHSTASFHLKTSSKHSRSLEDILLLWTHVHLWVGGLSRLVTCTWSWLSVIKCPMTWWQNQSTSTTTKSKSSKKIISLEVCKHFATTLFLSSFNLVNASSANLITLWSDLTSLGNKPWQSFENLSQSIKGLSGWFDTPAFKASLMAMHIPYTCANLLKRSWTFFWISFTTKRADWEEWESIVIGSSATSTTLALAISKELFNESQLHIILHPFCEENLEGRGPQPPS